MGIVVKLEFVFDNADDVLDFLGQLTAPEEPSLPTPQSGHQARIDRTEAKAQPLMDMLASALAKKGLLPVRLQDQNEQDRTQE